WRGGHFARHDKDRPACAGGSNQRESPRRKIFGVTQNSAARLQQLRQPPRQRSGDDPRNIRECANQKSDGTRNGRRRDEIFHSEQDWRFKEWRWRTDVDLRRGDEIRGNENSFGHSRRTRIRDGLIARLGSERDTFVRRESGDRGKL